MNEEVFQRLFQMQIEGMTTEEQRARLAEILGESEAARRLYVEQMRMHARLAWMLESKQEAARPAPGKMVRFAGLRRAVLRAAAVLLTCSLLGLGWQAWNKRGAIDIEVVTASHPSYVAGQRLTRKHIALDQGMLGFRLASGALVEVSGPAALDLISPMHVRLLNGSLTADVGEGAKGFIVETAQARLVDQGTRFGVTADTGQTTDVAVFEGKVDVYERTTPRSANPDVTLIAGEAVRVEASRKTRRLQMVRIGPDGRSLEHQRATDLVTAVSDNVSDDPGDEDFRDYYGLVRGGMAEGTRIYTTGVTRTWHALPDEVFPPELVGTDVVCTFADNRHRLDKDLEVRVTVARPCDIYLLPDTRNPLPDWIAREWTDTGLRLRSGPWPYAEDAAGQPLYRHAIHAVFKKHISEAGVVTLGSPNPLPGKTRPLMYGIAVKESPPEP